MNKEKTLDLPTISDCRKSIDRLDAILVFTLAERFKQTKNIGKIKAINAIPASDPKREAEQLKKIKSLSQEAGLDTKFAKRFLDFVITEVIKDHEKLQK